MGLAHDNDGFLTGPAADIDAASYAKHLAILREIRADGAAMRSDLSAIRKQISKPSLTPPALALPVRRVSAANDARARLLNGSTSPSGRTATPRTATPVVVVPSPNSGGRSAAVAPGQSSPLIAQPRKSNGRFGTGDGPGSSPDGDIAARKDKEASSSLADAAGALQRGAAGAMAGASQVDPSLAAAKEVKDMVSPALGVFKPLGRLFGRRSGKSDAEKAAQTAVPWYRRLWGELRELNKKAGGKSGMGGILGMLGGLLGGLTKIPLLGMLAKGAGGMLGGLLKGGGALLGGAGGLLGKLGKGLLKRIPLIGGLIAGGSALSSIFGDGDPNKSAAENRRDRFTGGAGGLGAIIGGAIGLLGGPVGVVVGGILGEAVGSKVGEWMAEVNWGDVGKSITDTWDTASGWVKSAFGGATDYIKESWGKVTDLGASVFKSVGEWLDKTTGRVKELAVGAATAVSSAATKAHNAVSTVYDRAAKSASGLAESATISGGRLLGSLSKGYRHRESFDGISGGAGLARNGTYTNDEAARIRQLKSDGSNTSANLRGGMPDRIKKKIEAGSLASGLSPEDMLKVAALESGGNANAISSTGAIGVYQFTGGTATGVGITNRFDEDQNIAGGMRLAKANQEYLKKKGLPVTPENLYMMHQLGPSAASEIIRGASEGKRIDQLSQGAQFGVRNNVGAGSSTAADYLAKNSRALDDRYNSVVNSSQPSVAVPSVPPLVSPISVSSKPVNYTPTAPDLMRYAPKATPAVKSPIGSNSKPGGATTRIEQPLSQNLGDRQIAAVATGGIGMQQMRV